MGFWSIDNLLLLRNCVGCLSNFKQSPLFQARSPHLFSFVFDWSKNGDGIVVFFIKSTIMLHSSIVIFKFDDVELLEQSLGQFVNF